MGSSSFLLAIRFLNYTLLSSLSTGIGAGDIKQLRCCMTFGRPRGVGFASLSCWLIDKPMTVVGRRSGLAAGPIDGICSGAFPFRDCVMDFIVDAVHRRLLSLRIVRLDYCTMRDRFKLQGNGGIRRQRRNRVCGGRG